MSHLSILDKFVFARGLIALFLMPQFGRKKKKYRGKVNSTSSSKESEKKEVKKDNEEEEEDEEEDGDLSKYKLDVGVVVVAGNLYNNFRQSYFCVT